MRCFGLTPDQVLARDPTADVARFPSLPFSIGYGAIVLSVVSTAAYSIWAFGLIRNEGVLYATIALVYMVVSGFALGRLVVGAGASRRFAALFAVAFLVYAALWCAIWFGLRRQIPHSDFWGSVAGLAAAAFLLCRAFQKPNHFLLLFLVLLAFHSAGYYLGGYLYDTVRDAAGRRTATGRLLWGAAHGLGFGAGLGFLLFHAQSNLKMRLRPANPASH